MSPEQALPKESGNLDLLRAFAVGAVYFGHLLQLWDVERLGPFSARAFAHTGVLVFFVHTALVLMFSMQRIGADRLLELFTVFIVRRVFRIYPLSIVVVATTLAFSIPSFPPRVYVSNAWFDVFANFALVQNLTLSPSVLDPLWSLPIELQMYLLLPFLFVVVEWLNKKGLAVLWLLAVLAATLQEQFLATRLSIAQYAPCFLSGVVGYALMKGRRRELPVVGWVGIIAIAFALRQVGFEAGWFACLLIGISVPWFRELGQGAVRTGAAWIAKFSYGIYLSHVVVFWIAFVKMGDAPGWLQWAVCALLSCALPVAMYYGVERPMIGLGVRLADRWRTGWLAADTAR